MTPCASGQDVSDGAAVDVEGLGDPLLLFAGAVAATNFVHSGRVEPGLRMSLAERDNLPASPERHVTHVVRVCARSQVERVDACGRVAAMQNVGASRYFAVVGGVGKPVRGSVSVLPVAVLETPPRPQAAAGVQVRL